ncbi:MAG TPA: hypothetical protein VGI70_08660, partial [Polyangiales bacterium]
AVGRNVSPWLGLPDGIRDIVAFAFHSADSDKRLPNAGDLLEALVRAPEIAAALAARQIDIDALIAEVRARIAERQN